MRSTLKCISSGRSCLESDSAKERHKRKWWEWKKWERQERSCSKQIDGDVENKEIKCGSKENMRVYVGMSILTLLLLPPYVAKEVNCVCGVSSLNLCGRFIFKLLHPFWGHLRCHFMTRETKILVVQLFFSLSLRGHRGQKRIPQKWKTDQ